MVCVWALSMKSDVSISMFEICLRVVGDWGG